MKTRFIPLAVFFLAITQLLFAQTFRTETFSDQIKTLRVAVVDNWQLPPVIELEGDQVIEVSFDELGERPLRYTYTLTHCNADWKPSSLVQSEFMSGFQHSFIEDYANSYNTTMDYVNYKLYFPNPDLTMKVSGNYVVRVYRENDEEHPVLSACFSVLESQTTIHMQVTSQTDVGVNKNHQQVKFDLNYTNNRISPMQDLKVYVLQNNRWDNCAALVQPLNIQVNKLVYDHNPKLIFEAGNEYRRFEMLSHLYNGLGIDAISYHAPYYHIDIRPEPVRANRTYSYDEDIDGKYLIRCQDGVEYDIESDYYFVHFFLPCTTPYLDNVYLLGELFNNLANEQSKMDYSEADHGYVKTVLLKAGHYNYMYTTRKNGSPVLSTALIEGNYFQTENEYSSYIYYRPSGGRYDQLIGFQTLRYK